MHARIDDPIGPIWLRASPLLVAFALVAGFVAVALPYGLAREATAAALLLGAIVLAVPTLLPRVAPRDALVVPGDGFIDVMHAGLLSQRIRTRDVVAASAARTMGGAAIALVQRGRRRRPTILDFENDEDVHRVRDALGVSHFGCGALEWTTARGDAGSAAKIFRLLAAVSLAALAYGLIDSPRSHALLLGGLLLPTVPLALILMAGTLVELFGRGPTVALAPDALWIRTTNAAPIRIEYGAIADVRVVDEKIVVIRHCAPPVTVRARRTLFSRARLSENERQHLAAQILSAAHRAHGAGPPLPPVPARAWDLAKRGEPGRSWFARIDAFAQSFTSGYRGASFGPDDLWATLENHDAPADLRVAAARVLVRVSEASRPRVDAILARVRDDDARDKLRAAMREDIDDAGEAIDRISAREWERERLRAR